MAAAFVGMPLMLIVFVFATLPIDDCDPGAYCQYGTIWGMFIPALIIVGAVGFATKIAVNWLSKCSRSGR